MKLHLLALFVSLTMISPLVAQQASPSNESTAPIQQTSPIAPTSPEEKGESEADEYEAGRLVPWNGPLWNGLNRVLHKLNALQGLLIVVFTGILVLYNRSLAKETAELRKRETEPKLEVYLVPYEGGSVLINMVVRNVGGGAARDIKWNIDADEADLDSHNVKIHKMALFKVLHYLPSQEKIVFFFGSGPEILKEPALKPVKISVTYRNDGGKNPRSDSFIIDLQPMVGLATLGLPPNYEIAKALKEISKNLDWIVTGFKPPLIRTVDEGAYQKSEEERRCEIRASMSDQQSETRSGRPRILQSLRNLFRFKHWL